jgi:methylated-DNA-[protein]-cysteine S-methyltransferase
MKTLTIAETDTPMGKVRIAQHGGRVCALAFCDDWARLERTLSRRFGADVAAIAGPMPEIVGRLRDYLAGDLAALEAVAVDPGGTAFQRSVWTALRRVPAGHLTSYGALAREIGSPKAVRAVGAANGANPVSLVIPCHRAIGSDGSLTGYAGGIPRKRWLLAHEQIAASPALAHPSQEARELRP